MTEKNKKIALLGGAAIICAALVFGIFSQMGRPAPPEQASEAKESSQAETPEISIPEASLPEITIPKLPEQGSRTEESSEAGGQSEESGSGTTTAPPASGGSSQPLQPEPAKPSDPPEDPAKEEDTHDHESVPEPPPASDAPQGGETQDGMIYVPGFGWIPDEGGGGSGSGVGNSSDELTGNKVGEM